MYSYNNINNINNQQLFVNPFMIGLFLDILTLHVIFLSLYVPLFSLSTTKKVLIYIIPLFSSTYEQSFYITHYIVGNFTILLPVSTPTAKKTQRKQQLADLT